MYRCKKGDRKCDKQLVTHHHAFCHASGDFRIIQVVLVASCEAFSTTSTIFVPVLPWFWRPVPGHTALHTRKCHGHMCGICEIYSTYTTHILGG